MPRCVVLVNLYGQSADMDALLPICERYGVPVLEDAAESLGATYKGRPSGSFGRIGVYSFNGNKIITTSGGGMLVSDDEGWCNAPASCRRRRATRRRTTSTARSASTTA
jgi:dTDP-4-amino-4,6-dideoxygalactose transaminase